MTRPSMFQVIRSITDVQDQPEFVETPTPIPAYSPTYENRLRLIGRHLDRGDYRASVILEVPGGVLVRARKPATGQEELLEFPDDTFEELYEEAMQDRGDSNTDQLRLKSVTAPTGYQDLFRALGYRLDQVIARAILISECQESIFVRGQGVESNSMRTAYIDFSEMLTLEDIDEMLNESHARRRK